MSTKRFEPESAQIISDLGQLKAFTHPVQARLLRILQKREATLAELAEFIDEPPDAVAQHLDALRQAGLIKELGHRNGDAGAESSYRAGARYYGFRPDPADLELVAGPVTMALLQAVSQELVASMDEWPNQRMIGQLRRARLSPSRLMEFEERFEELVDEFWGSPDQPAAERDGDPVMSLGSVVYRYPDQP